VGDLCRICLAVVIGRRECGGGSIGEGYIGREANRELLWLV